MSGQTMERWCSRCGRPAIGMQAGAIVRDGEELLQWSESLCRSCLDAIDRSMPAPPTPAEQAAAADEFLAQIWVEALAAEAAGDAEHLRALGPFLDDLADDFPRRIPDDLLALAARFRTLSNREHR